MAELSSPEDGSLHDLDLPLMSNYKDIHIRHYVLNLTCDMDSKQFVGYITLFCDFPSIETSSGDLPNIVDDGTLKDVPNHSVSALPHTSLDWTTLSSPTISLDGNDENHTHLDRVSGDLPNVEGDGTLKDVQSHSVPALPHTSSDMTELSSPTISSDGNNDNHIHLDTVPVNYEEQYDETNKTLIPKVTIGSSHGEHAAEITSIALNTNISRRDDVGVINQVVTSPTPVVQERTRDFVMVLDCWDLDVNCVEEMANEPSELKNGIEHEFDGTKVIDKGGFTRDNVHTEVSTNRLHYSCEKKCIRIWKNGVECAQDFPRCVRITYSTCPRGHSLKWTKDQDGSPCVYTHGHWINNRSLFPSQDVPGAMATWQATIHVPHDMVVLMSGDTDPTVTHDIPGSSTFMYHTSMTMPSSTLALTVGYWTQVSNCPETDRTYTSLSHETTYSSPGAVIPWRLFAPRKHGSLSGELLKSYMPRCMEAASRLLGAHPFRRLDILVVPASFASLGMASPSLMFISQSVLSPDKGMLVRLAHELSHSWFGLLIGPRDWTEEWLSEGFCTYTESIIHDVVMEVNDDTCRQMSAIRDYLKYKTLEAEVQSTGEHLQTLRSGYDHDDTDSVEYIKNGMNPDKGFMQLHYLKGYFLLVHMEHLVGREEFFRFLRLFVRQFNKKLIKSKDVFVLFLETFPALRESGITEESLMTEWLDRPGLPPVDVQLTTNNTLATQVFQMVERITDFNKTYSKLHWRKRRKLDIPGCLGLQKVGHVQTLLLLHKLSEESRLHPDILCAIDTTLQLSSSNADVLHGWCDLVIKNRVEPHYKDVCNFLLHHQAMGVYLFGEMILAKDQRLRTLAEDCFKTLQDDMEDGVHKTVRSMVYGY